MDLCLRLLTRMKNQNHFWKEHQKLYHISGTQRNTENCGHPNWRQYIQKYAQKEPKRIRIAAASSTVLSGTSLLYMSREFWWSSGPHPTFQIGRLQQLFLTWPPESVPFVPRAFCKKFNISQLKFFAGFADEKGPFPSIVLRVLCRHLNRIITRILFFWIWNDSVVNLR